MAAAQPIFFLLKSSNKQMQQPWRCVHLLDSHADKNWGRRTLTEMLTVAVEMQLQAYLHLVAA